MAPFTQNVADSNHLDGMADASVNGLVLVPESPPSTQENSVQTLLDLVQNIPAKAPQAPSALTFLQDPINKLARRITQLSCDKTKILLLVNKLTIDGTALIFPKSFTNAAQPPPTHTPELAKEWDIIMTQAK